MDYSYIHPPLLTPDLPGVGGVLKSELADFRVDEIAAYEPAGEGDHLFVKFEKRDLDTKRAISLIASALESNPRDAGWAGLKDRHAITTQWASFAGADASRALGLELEGIRILEAVPHGNKLRTGHLRGNRFVLRLRDVRGSAADAAAVLDELCRHGCPNYFGAQRFGYGGKNVERARRWIVDGERAPRARFERKLLVSSLQSALFNEVLGRRVADGLLGGWVRGDLMKKVETGGLFISESEELDAARVEAFEISPTGPMFGAKMRWPEEDAREREAAVLERAGLTDEHLRRFKKAGEGTRRVLRVRPGDATVEADGADLILSFTLEKGAYATVIAREIMKPEVADEESPS